MKNKLTYHKDSFPYINNLLSKNLFKGVIFVSGQNFTFGGPWTVLNDAIDNLAEYKKDYLIIVIVFKKLEKNYKNVINLICKDSKKSWIHRLFYEKYKFMQLSKSITNEIDVWISMHDITPIVKAKKLITYYHNPSPFWKPRVYQMFLSPVTTLFMLFYFKVCQLNISRNYALIVQQIWIKKKFIKKFPNLNIVVSKPISNKAESLSVRGVKDLSKYNELFVKPFLLCPTTPRVFKNIETAIQATKNLKKYNLLITVKGNENIYTKYLKLIYSKIKNVSFIGHVEKEVLEILYKKADAIIFPSQLETWGLPITESIKFNKLIFVPDLDYSRETCGDYDRAIFFNSGSSNSLKDKLSKYLLSGEFQKMILKNNKKLENLDNMTLDCWNKLWRKLI